MAQAPLPDPTIAVAQPHIITYLFTDNSGNRPTELPLTGVTFSKVLNGAGQFTGTLQIEDPRVQNLDWIGATQENLTCLWVIADYTTVLWGGMVQQTTYTMSKQTWEVKANEFWAYLNQRVQDNDYSGTWATTATQAGAMEMAYRIISDDLSNPQTLPLLSGSVVKQGSTPAQYEILASFPLSQQQQLGSLVQQLQQMGYLVGFDTATDVNIDQGVVSAQLTLSYPRRGRIAGTTGLTLDVSQATEFIYPTDGTQQANRVWEMATATGGIGSERTWGPAITTDGYPLLETVQSHMVFSVLTYYTNEEVQASQAVLNAWAANDLFLYAYPPIVPQVTVPMYGASVEIGDFIVGDDIRLYLANSSALPPNPRFPNGIDQYWRITGVDVSISDEGLSTMTLTLNVPPSTVPQHVEL